MVRIGFQEVLDDHLGIARHRSPYIVLKGPIVTEDVLDGDSLFR